MVQQGIHSTIKTGAGARFRVAGELDRQLWRLLKSPVSTWRSPARFGSLSARDINASEADVVNLHWVTDGFLTIEQIGRIKKPLVWSLVDMWPFAGTEHYGSDGPDGRWRSGYTRSNRPAGDRGVDIDRLTWELKRSRWTRPMHIVAASTWMRERAESSALFSSWPVHQIPHVVECDVFSPMSSHEARSMLGLPVDRPIVLFLSSAGIGDLRKGWDLLDAALARVRTHHPDVLVVIAGPASPDSAGTSGAPIHWAGQISGNDALRVLYSACDVTAVPSREDNMPLTAMEAQSCGRPVVAFRIGGLPDIVSHQQTGYLAPAFDTEALAEGVIQAIDDAQHDENWGRAARWRALSTWSGEAIVPQYLDVYAQALT